MMFELPSLCLCFIIFGITRLVFSLGILGPANFVFKSAEVCPDAPKGIRLEISARKVDRINFGVSFDIDTPYDFDDELGLTMTACLHVDGGCKEAFVYNATNACTTLEAFIGNVFADLQKKAGWLEGCPFPKGNYKVDDWIFDNDKLDKPVLYGDYTSKLVFTHKWVEQSCVMLNYEFVAKNKL